MNKELSKTLTTALVQFIDRERPEDTMCCSNTDCENIRVAFEEGEYEVVESFIQHKLSILTEFETHLKWLIENGGSGIEHVKVGANELLALAKKELLKDNELAKKHLEGYIMGRNDALHEMSDFIESHFNGEKAKEGTYYKDYKRNPEPVPTGIGVVYKSPNNWNDVMVAPNINSGTSTAKVEG